jgi:hypothetical protein
MIIPITVSEEHEIRAEAALSELTFKSLGLRESQLEEFIRQNIQLIFSEEEEDDDQTLLIVGQQVIDAGGDRNDLVALDGDGSLVLIEIKRDSQDMMIRSEPMELQAIRYAASLATIKSPEELVDRIFVRYINKRREEFALGEAEPEVFGKQKVKDFLKKNNADSTFNNRQRIILIASDFDEHTLSASAWMAKNGIDISCVRITPIKEDTSIKEGMQGRLFLEIIKLIPPTQFDDFLVPYPDGSMNETRGRSGQRGVPHRVLPRMAELMDQGIVKTGDKLTIKGRTDSEAEIVDAKHVKFKGETMSFSEWGQKVTGWTKIGIYDWAMKGNVTLAEIRDSAMASGKLE